MVVFGSPHGRSTFECASKHGLRTKISLCHKKEIQKPKTYDSVSIADEVSEKTMPRLLLEKRKHTKYRGSFPIFNTFSNPSPDDYKTALYNQEKSNVRNRRELLANDNMSVFREMHSVPHPLEIDFQIEV